MRTDSPSSGPGFPIDGVQREFGMVEHEAQGSAAPAGEREWRRVVMMEGINNFRDYGDVPTRGGGQVRKGLLFRSGHLARASAADTARLAQLGVAMVTDLRSAGEQAEQPSKWLAGYGAEVIEEPGSAERSGETAPHIAAFQQSDFSPDAMAAFLEGYYAVMPYEARHVRLFGRYFAALAERDGAMLIHCAAGKDRTGMLAWLTHQLLEVHPDDALEDFMLSNDAANVADRLPHLKRRMEASYGRAIADDALRAMLSVRPGFIANAQRAITERSGSIDAYLAEVLGVDAARRAAIRARLIA